LSGEVVMHHLEGGERVQSHLHAGMIAVVEQSDEHVAEPVGVARILVVERVGSP
jgi:hypothetical protein